MGSRKLALCSLVFAPFLWAAAQAQTAGVVNLRANQTSATGSLVPVLTWSTNPTAQSCRASGGWSGEKAPNGTQTLTVIRANANYTLTCTWGSGSAVVHWTIPRTNTNGSTLTNLASFRVLYGTSASSLNQTLSVTDITRTSATVPSLATGRWYFAVRAVNTSNVLSAASQIWQKDVTGATAARNVAITITPSTTPPPTTPPPTTPPPTTPPPTTGTLLTAATQVYDVLTSSTGALSLGRVVGKIAVGRPCNAAYPVGTAYYRVDSGVEMTDRSRSYWNVARCTRQ